MSLEHYRHAALELAALAEAACELLKSAGIVPGDPRIQGAPEPRTLRYYQTLGLLDRPLRYEGRRALYGLRHLLQVLAIKLLQVEGQSLAQIQRALVGRSNSELEEGVRSALAQAPASSLAPIPSHAASPPRLLLTVEVLSGVFVTIDPERVVGEPEAVIRRITAGLASQGRAE